MSDWRADALCSQVDPTGGMFYMDEGVERGKGKWFYLAEQVCARCPVAAACLEEGLKVDAQFGEWGIWGGLNPRARRKIRKAREAEEAAS